MTCHNRSEKTYRCVKTLCKILNYLKLNYEIVIVLDNCFDNTKVRVVSLNDKINIIDYRGEDLFWAGGMVFGYNKAISGEVFEYLICINDDIELNFENTVRELNIFFNLTNSSSSALVGSFQNQANSTSYGALTKISKVHPLKLQRINPNEDLPIHTFNMNFVILPKTLINKVGFLSESYRHSKADLDFGYRITKANFKILKSTAHLGFCERNPSIGEPCYNETNLKKALLCLNSPTREPIKERWSFLQQHGTFGLRLVHLLMPYLKFIVCFWLNKIMSSYR